MRQLILGSTSKPRQNLLTRLHIPFEIAAPDVDETPLLGEMPEQLVMRLAEAKARKVSEQYNDAIIIGADQVGVLDDRILGKPMTHENAVEQLHKISGRHVEFFIGLCVLDSKSQERLCAMETFSVTFRKLTDSMIDNYLRKEQPLHCAGSFKAEGLGIALVHTFHDTDFSALIGLPLIRLIKMLEKMGISVL
jgi:septum formation protein